MFVCFEIVTEPKQVVANKKQSNEFQENSISESVWN